MVSPASTHAVKPTASARPDLGGWPIVGHEWAVRFLQGLTAPPSPRGLRHAYLLLGPAHIGKSRLARLFAQAIHCGHAEARPCHTCRACGLMTRGNHVDFRLISPTDKDGAVDRVDGLLRAEAAEQIVRDAALRPVESGYKVFLIQDAHQAHSAFANKLLKTLEEPPPNVVLLLTATDRARLLPTIVSRCQTLELRPTPRELIRDALVAQHGAEMEQADLLARLANGRMGWALAQLTAGDATARLEQLELLWRLVEAGSAERLDWAEKSATNRNSSHLFGLLELWVNWWRDVLLYQAGCGETCNNIDQIERLDLYAQSVPQQEIRDYLETIRRIEGYLHHTVNTRLALDVLVLRLPCLKPNTGV